MGTGSLRLRGRTWQARYTHNGKLVEVPLKPDPVTGKPLTAKQARERLRELLRTASTPDHLGPDVKRLTFSDLRAGIVADYTRKNNRSGRRLEQALVHLAQMFGQDLALRITDERVLKYIEGRQAESASSSTVNRELAVLRRMFRLHRHLRRYAPEIHLFDERDNIRDGFADPAEFDALLAALRARDEGAVVDVTEFAYLTLMRRENALGLQWAHLTLRVESGAVVGGRVRLPGTMMKNKNPLSLVLRGRLLHIIGRRWASRIPASPFVFHRDGRRIVRFEGAWRAACTAAGLAGLRFHDLRRSGARNLRRAGVPESVIQRMGGWKTRAMFLRYAITDDRDLEQAADAYDAFLDAAEASERVVVPLTGRV